MVCSALAQDSAPVVPQIYCAQVGKTLPSSSGMACVPFVAATDGEFHITTGAAGTTSSRNIHHTMRWESFDFQSWLWGVRDVLTRSIKSSVLRF